METLRRRNRSNRRLAIDPRIPVCKPLEQRLVLSAEGPLQVLESTAFASGVEMTLNQPPDLELLNLYVGLDGQGSAADVELIGQAGGRVTGSLVWSADESVLRFVASRGPLTADQYQLRIPSRADGLVAADGGIAIDGDLDGTAGDDYRFDFEVPVDPARTLSIASFVRGPGQPVALNGTLGMPLRIDNGQDLTRLDLVIRFDPSLVNLTGASTAASLPGDWNIESFEAIAPDEVRLIAAGTTPLTAGPQDLLVLDAFMRFDAPYRAEGIIAIENVLLNEGALAARGDRSLQVVAFLGDVTGQDLYSSLDAAFVARVAVGNDSGFAAFNRIDPVLLGDASGSGDLSAFDAAMVARTAVDLPQPEVPATDNHVFARRNRYEMAADELFAANMVLDDTGDGVDTGVAANDPLRVIELADQAVAGVTVLRTARGTELVVSPDGSLRLSDAQAADFSRLLTGNTITDSFSYTIQNATGLTDTATVEIRIIGTAELPSAAIRGFNLIVGVPFVATTEDIFSDQEHAELVESTASRADGSSLPNWLTFDGAALDGTPGESDIGSYEIRVESRDAAGALLVEELTVAVHPYRDIQLEIVVRPQPTAAEAFTVFTALPSSDDDHGVGRLTLVTDRSGTRLDYSLIRITAFDFDGQKTPVDASDDVISVSFQVDDTDVFAIPLDDADGLGELHGSWTTDDSLTAAHLEALRSGRLSVNIRANPSQPANFRLAGRNFGVSQELSVLPLSIEDFELNSSYVAEIWVRDTKAGSLGFSSLRLETSYDAQLNGGPAVANIDGPLREFADEEEGVDVATGQGFSRLEGASVFLGVGTLPSYARLGYVEFDATLAGVQQISLGPWLRDFGAQVSGVLRIGDGIEIPTENVHFFGGQVNQVDSTAAAPILRNVNLVADVPFSFDVANLLVGQSLGEVASVSATLANGEPVPAWLGWDGNFFTCTPDETNVGDHSLWIDVVDVDGGHFRIELDIAVTPYVQIQVDLVARTAPTDVSEFTVYVANPESNNDSGVGRIELITDASGTRLDYELTRLTDFDFDAAKTPNDPTDDIISMSFRSGVTNVFFIPLEGENRTGKLRGSWTEADGFNAAMIEAIHAGQMRVNIRYDRALPKDVKLGGREFSPSAELRNLPQSIDRVAVGDSYYVEVWVRDNVADSLGISSVQWTTTFDSQLTHSAPDAHLEGALPEFSHVSSNASSFSLTGASLFLGVGVRPHYARLGYALIEASAEGIQHFDLSTLVSSQIRRIGVGDSIPSADILFTSIDVRHDRAG